MTAKERGFIVKMTQQGHRLPWEPYYTNWVKLGVYICLHHNEFIPEMLLNLPENVESIRVPAEVRDAISGLYFSKVKVDMLSVDTYIKENYPYCSPAGVYLISLLDGRDWFWYSHDSAKAFYAQSFIKHVMNK